VSLERLATVGEGQTPGKSALGNLQAWEAESASWPEGRPRQLANVVVLFLTDIAALLMATALGYLLWIGPVLHQSGSAYLNLVPLIWLFPLGYAGAGLYPGFGVGAVETLRKLTYCTSFAFLTIAAATFVLKLPPVYSRMGCAVAWGASIVLVPLLRFVVLGVISRQHWWHEPVVLVGGHQWIQRAARSLRNARSLGYRPLVALCPDSLYEETVEDVPVLGGLELAPVLAERGLRVAMIAEGDQVDSALNWLQQHFHRVIVMSAYGELPVEPVQVCNLGDVFGLQFTNNLLLGQNRVIKRTLDIVLGTILLAIAFPLILAAGICVKLSSEGSVFFCQEREGLEGHKIKVWKLRTMYKDAERRLDQFLIANPQLRQEWAKHFKLAADPRIIPGIGTFLRRFSIDELPQVTSIITGKMSFVGPRPFPRYHLQRLPADFCELRRRVRPGLTGLWQVMGRSDSTLEQQKTYDTYYIRNWSIWLDLYILARTAFAVLSGRGAY
jgi:Undecaprenyl-phosphate galactose phosphotransferase WbaP